MMNKVLFFLTCLGLMLLSCDRQDKNDPLRVIFDTDMGNDIDDALALAMLNNYVDMGMADLMAVISSKDHPYSAKYIDLLNTWYAHGDIPIGVVVDGKKKQESKYANPVVDMQRDGSPVFVRSLSNETVFPEAVSLYRSLLSDAPDSSVVIIAVGVSTNIARLIESGPDDHSPLTGVELVSRKVDYLSMMAGNFVKPLPEANIFNDSAAADKVFRDWPTKIVISPFDVGLALKYPAESIESDFNFVDLHPLAEGYRAYLPMPYDRPTWDLTSVLYSLEEDSAYFTMHGPGRVSLGYNPDHPRHVTTVFESDEKGLHYYLSLERKDPGKALDRLIGMTIMDPNRN